jgi:PIN domain nuclease of toxin-antitoxin system
VVLDSSALLAVLFREVGAAAVNQRLPDAVMSAVNLAEVAARMVERGVPLEKTVEILTQQPLEVIPFDAEQSYLAVSLRPATWTLGLSLGDRACLALGLKRGLPVLTADQLWAKADVGVQVEVIR